MTIYGIYTLNAIIIIIISSSSSSGIEVVDR